MQAGMAAGLVGRDAVLEQVESALAGGRGALIVGPAGIGKTALARAVVEGARGYYVETLYGTEVSRRSPYGALAPLLSELPLSGTLKPMHALQQIHTLLRRNAGTAPLLIVVDDADDLDVFSVLVISQLARRGDAAVVATATDLLRADPEVLSLWADGFIQRIDVEPLTPAQSRSLMERILGGPVSERAGREMWQETHGNPHFTMLMTKEQVNRGRLILSDRTWVRARSFVHSGMVAEVLAARLAKLPADQRKLIEVVSRISPLPLELGLGLTAPETLDALEEDGTVEFEPGPVPSVRLGNGLGASVIAANIPLGRSHQLWNEVSALLEDTDVLTPPALAGFVAWTLACGADPGPERILRAAQYANDSGTPSDALGFVRSVEPAVRGQELVCEEVRALSALGEYQDAYAVLTQFEPGFDPNQRESWMNLMLHKAALLRSLPKLGDAQAVLDSAGARGDSTEAAAAVELARAELLMAEGDYALAVGPLRELAGRAGVSDRVRALASSAAAEALAVTGHAADALALIGEAQRFLQTPLPAPDQSVIVTRLFYALFAAGELNQAVRFVHENIDGAGNSYRGSAGELVGGVIRAAAGEADAAIEALVPAVAQLRFCDPEDLLPLATALLSYAYGMRGDPAQAAAYRFLAPRLRHRPYWHAERVTTFFHTLSLPEEMAGAVCRRLIRMGEEAESRGNVSMAMACYEAAASRGDLAAAAELARISSTATGRWAEALSTYGRGLLSNDPHLLLTAARGAAELGHQFLSYRAAGLVRTNVPAPGGSLARRAAAVENAAYRKLRRENSLEHILGSLTDFEARLVDMAAGTWSRTRIAEELHLSPRTVDWHLSKLFRKLRVTGRTELREVLLSAG
ncbi:AAA family ATPase [Arthrobacter sp. BL-252-APC-1A]|nr:AAA family ATPase [Arthrobacter sp. BL-252-APC-1A]